MRPRASKAVASNDPSIVIHRSAFDNYIKLLIQQDEKDTRKFTAPK